MIVTKKSLSRRTVLRGMGVGIAIPFLDAMVPALGAASTATGPVPRLGFIYLPNGVGVSVPNQQNYWLPLGDGPEMQLSPALKPLEPYRNRLVVVSGLDHAQAEALGDGNGDHSRATSSWLSGVHPKFTEGSDIHAGVTADQIAAQSLGEDTQLPSLELSVDLNFVVGNCESGYSCAYMNTLSWRTATTPIPTTNNPRTVFERLFGRGGSGAQAQQRWLRRSRSVLDWASEDMSRLQKTLGAGDRARLDEYFDAIREIERRLQNAGKRGSQSSAPEFETPAGIPDQFDEHVKSMYDLQWLAFQADLTRVCTFMVGRELSQRLFPEIGVLEPHHALSHHQDKRDSVGQLARINAFQSELFAYFLQKLDSTRDGDGSLLDHSLFLYGAGLGEPNRHSHTDLPLLLMGGLATRSQGGRNIACKAGTPMTNLLLTMLDRAGVPTEQLGDSTDRLSL